MRIVVETPLSVAKKKKTPLSVAGKRDHLRYRDFVGFFVGNEAFTEKEKLKKEVDYFWKHQKYFRIR
jgi:hypothetical protein